MSVVGKVNSVRLLQGFANAAAAQVKVLEMIAAETDRVTRDAILIAVDSLKEQGVAISNEQASKALKAASPCNATPYTIPTLTTQAKARIQRRERIKDPFHIMDATVKTLRGEIANAESQDPK